MTGETLLPCPFCGGPAEIWRAHKEPYALKAWIACMGDCGGRKRGTVLTTEYDTDAEAIAAWNRRSLHAALDLVIEAVEAWPELTAIFPAGEPNTIRSIRKNTLLRDLRALRASAETGE